MKRALSFILTICMAVCMMPFITFEPAVYAAGDALAIAIGDAELYTSAIMASDWWYVNGESSWHNEEPDSWNAHFSKFAPSSGVTTLRLEINGLNLTAAAVRGNNSASCAIYAVSNLDLIVQGECSLETIASGSALQGAAGIMVERGDLCLEGNDAQLSVICNSGDSYEQIAAIAVSKDCIVSGSGLELTLIADDLSSQDQKTVQSNGMYIGQNLTVTEGAAVYAYSGDISTNSTSSVNMHITSGIYANSLNVGADSKISALSGTAEIVSGSSVGVNTVGIYVISDAAINDSAIVSVAAMSATNAAMSAGLYIGGTLDCNGHVYAKAGDIQNENDAKRSSGMYVGNGATFGENACVNLTGGNVYGNDADDAQSCGLYYNGSLTFAGNDETSQFTGKAAQYSYGIYGQSGTATLGGCLEATAGNAEYLSAGIYTSGNINFSSADVTASAEYSDMNSCGIHVDGNVSVQESCVNATAGKADNDSCGIRTNSFAAEDSVVFARSAEANASDGIHCLSYFTSTDSALDILAAVGGDESDGIYAENGISICGSADDTITVKASNGGDRSIALYSPNSVSGYINVSCAGLFQTTARITTAYAICCGDAEKIHLAAGLYWRTSTGVDTTNGAYTWDASHNLLQTSLSMIELPKNDPTPSRRPASEAQAATSEAIASEQVVISAEALQQIDSGRTFEDTAGKWFAEAASFMGHKGLMGGRGGADFAGGSDLSKAEFSAIMLRTYALLEGSGIDSATGLVDLSSLSQQYTAAHSFTDVSDAVWYSGLAGLAQSLGLVQGDENGAFGGSRSISRQEVMTIIYRMALLLDPSQSEAIGAMGLAGYEDADAISSWAYPAMQFGILTGLMQGDDNGLLRPQDTITRGEIAALTQRLVEYLTTH